MQPIDFQKFISAVQGSFLKTFNASQTTGLQNLITYLEQDANMTDLRWCAYALATCYWETGRTFQPVQENGHGAGHTYGNPDPITGETYYGRGYVQMTWKANYKEFSSVVGQDLVAHPELALEPNIAYRIMSFGMRKGMFTGVGFSHYFNNTTNDAVNARKIINGLDQANTIAGFYTNILRALQGSLV
jgi:hypothetical protein